jgi:hypothetical protein
VPEARLDDSGSGLAPASDDWLVVNMRDAASWTSDTFDSGCTFESREFWLPQPGINLRVLEPGQPNNLYHSESQHEAFLVLSGSAGCSSRLWSGSSGRGTSSTVPPGPSTSSWAQATGHA